MTENELRERKARQARLDAYVCAALTGWVTNANRPDQDWAEMAVCINNLAEATLAERERREREQAK